MDTSHNGKGIRGVIENSAIGLIIKWHYPPGPITTLDTYHDSMFITGQTMEHWHIQALPGSAGKSWDHINTEGE